MTLCRSQAHCKKRQRSAAQLDLANEVYGHASHVLGSVIDCQLAGQRQALSASSLMSDRRRTSAPARCCPSLPPQSARPRRWSSSTAQVIGDDGPDLRVRRGQQFEHVRQFLVVYLALHEPVVQTLKTFRLKPGLLEASTAATSPEANSLRTPKGCRRPRNAEDVPALEIGEVLAMTT